MRPAWRCPTAPEVLYVHACVCAFACALAGDPVLGLALGVGLAHLGYARPLVRTGAVVRAVGDAPEGAGRPYCQGSIGVVVASHPEDGWLVMWSWSRIITWCTDAELAPDGRQLREGRHAGLVLSTLLVVAEIAWGWS